MFCYRLQPSYVDLCNCFSWVFSSKGRYGINNSGSRAVPKSNNNRSCLYVHTQPVLIQYHIWTLIKFNSSIWENRSNKKLNSLPSVSKEMTRRPAWKSSLWWTSGSLSCLEPQCSGSGVSIGQDPTNRVGPTIKICLFRNVHPVYSFTLYFRAKWPNQDSDLQPTSDR
jgi:hypothetical protein